MARYGRTYVRPVIIGRGIAINKLLPADAGSYAPITILIEERSNGVRISYDRMASLLASYGSSDALKVAQGLDAKVERILTEAAE